MYIGTQVERDLEREGEGESWEGRTIIPDQTQRRLSLDEAEALTRPGDLEHASTSGDAS